MTSQLSELFWLRFHIMAAKSCSFLCYGKMKYISISILLCLLARGSIFCAENAAETQAYQDIKNNDYKILVYGEPLAGNIDHIIYKDKKIKLERVAGCLVTEEQVKYWDTYNSIVQKELLGDNDVWKLIDEEIKKIQNKNP